ncbi:hypothetical protein ACWGID_19920 [Kribbella sp. NPDC054772]
MAVSPYTFKGALAVLDIDDRSRSALEKFFGTAIFAGAGAAALAGGLTAAAWLSLVDPKSEAARELLDEPLWFGCWRSRPPTLQSRWRRRG